MKTLPEYLSDAGVTQAEFAKRVGTSQGNISKLCNGSSRISPALAARIAHATENQVPVTVWPQFRVFAQVASPVIAPSPEAAE
jgi:transcriptional regulator with XRE-family HTH domain